MKFRRLILLSVFAITPLFAKKPKLTLVMVVDQFAYHELQKLKKYLTGGIGFMLKNGLVYEQCYMPHGYPQTAVGHAAFATGTLAKDHGLVGNQWINDKGKMIASDYDQDVETTAVFAKDGLHKQGKSAKNMRVDTLSDQVMLRSSPQERFEAIALSLKSRAAIAMAGHAGLPFWLDMETGWFTSSKAFMPNLPSWVMTFNRKHKVDELKTVKWDLAYQLKNPAYQFNNINNYNFAGSWGLKEHTGRIAGTTIELDAYNEEGLDEHGTYYTLSAMPYGNKLLTELAKNCIDTYADYKKPENLLLWVSYSGLDKIGHPYGPDSLETIDMIYHTDKSIQDLIDHATKRYGAQNITLVLSADHGIMPLPEIVKEEGYTAARRISATELVNSVNNHIKKKLDVGNVIEACLGNQLYVNHTIFDSLPTEKQKNLLKEAKKIVTGIPGILRAWTFDELAQANYELKLNDLEAYFQNQLVPGRSGEIIMQVRPFTLIAYEKTGVAHTTPYDYDTHIPLVIYRSDLKAQQITKRVYAQQLAPTLAYLLDVPRPSASTFNLLPGIGK